jgi:hypothetical protein
MKSGSSGDLPHQIHAHAVAAQSEEGAMSEAQNAGISPNQIKAQR